MKIDEQTIKDLKIINYLDESSSIIYLFDNTKTEGGKRVLKKLFQEPLNDIPEIIAMQRSIKFIISNIDSWKIQFNDELTSAVQRYLRLNIISPYSSNPLKVSLLKHKYKENHYDIIQGIMNVAELVSRTQSFIALHIKNNLPEKLYRIINEINNFLKIPEIISITVNDLDKMSTSQIYRIDKVIRIDLLDRSKNFIDMYFYIDALVSLASSIIKYRFNFPEFRDLGYPLYQVEGLYHPFLENPVKYDVEIDNQKTLSFLTGPNMAGKTTFLKSLGVSVYLAHLGLAVPAKSLILSYFTCLISSINTEDNIKLGYSYFFSEVQRVKLIAESVRNEENAFIIIDEMFKGTNVHDALDATSKVINVSST